MRRGVVKVLLVFFCVFFIGAGITSAVGFSSGNWSNEEDGVYNSIGFRQVTSSYERCLEETLDLLRQQKDNLLTRSGRSHLEENQRNLDAAHTNFRFRVYQEDGSLFYTNVPQEEKLEDLVYYVNIHTAYLWEERTQKEISYSVEYGVCDPLEDTILEDGYHQARLQYFKVFQLYPSFGWISAACLGLGLLSLLLLLALAGRRPRREGVFLNWQDRIPYDLYLILGILGTTFLAATADSALWKYTSWWEIKWLVLFQGLVWAGVALILAALLTTATRIKSHTLFSNTLIWRLFSWIWKGLRHLAGWWGATFGSWSLTKRTILLFLAYLLGTVLTTLTIFLIPIYQGFVLFLLCRWVKEWKTIQTGTEAMVGGKTEVVIDTSGMNRFPCADLKVHGEQLNDLRAAIDRAVGERMKSERMKSELITNVSHDLKTPLTSIINYVDLLKKEEIPNEKAQEYLEVLDRKSQRLKKLTEDLIEASKASSGTLQTELAPLNLCQLCEQAIGEYQEKLEETGLTLLTSLPREEIWVRGDGHHLWRVLDNLLGNCVKYAMPGTRVYLDGKIKGQQMTLSLKNISREPLNVPADQLMERFVRGEESRTTEGSGLGLSIARSLMELQGGTFALSVDGDLFKAEFSLPLTRPPDPMRPLPEKES